MTELFIVVWSGGYDAPSYVATKTKPEAAKWAKQWTSEMDDGDTVDVLHLDLDTLLFERINADEL